MSKTRIFWLSVWMIVTLIGGITGGWQVAAGIILLVCIIAGFGSLGAAAELGFYKAIEKPQEPARDEREQDWIDSPPWYKGDPTAPDDPWPVVDADAVKKANDKKARDQILRRIK